MVLLFVVRFESCESVHAYIHTYVHTYIRSLFYVIIVICFCHSCRKYVGFGTCESVHAYIHTYHIHTYVVYFMLLLLYVIVVCVEDVYALERASLCMHT
jgi:hypothetical protein